ncbi:SDR family NAD(P)-dependent oxidoreductase [Candidatus Gracilibacteria bacterium]|nr:SDR family NAD(P)-dependent oxidoreductase [Candidatus Gracilibacteria bacterium]
MTNTRFALITGASSGIGEACAVELAKKGKNLILLARRAEKLESLKSTLVKEYGVEVLVHVVDLVNIYEIESFFKGIADRDVDVLINNAGLALSKTPFEDYKWEDFDQMINVNIKAFTRVAQLAIPHLKKTKGHIVNISSIAGIEAYEGGSVYCASKAFVKMISKALRIDLIGTGVRVTDIAPGNVETEFSMVRFKGDREVADSIYKGYAPLSAKDIADTIVFALSRPENVNIEYLLIMPTAQASATRTHKV